MKIFKIFFCEFSLTLSTSIKQLLVDHYLRKKLFNVREGTESHAIKTWIVEFYDTLQFSPERFIGAIPQAYKEIVG